MGPNRINKEGVQKQDIFFSKLEVEMTKSWLTDFPIKFLESG